MPCVEHLRNQTDLSQTGTVTGTEGTATRLQQSLERVEAGCQPVKVPCPLGCLRYPEIRTKVLENTQIVERMYVTGDHLGNRPATGAIGW